MKHSILIPESGWRIMKGSEIMYYPNPWFKDFGSRYVDLIQSEPIKEFYEFIADNMNAVLDGKSIDDTIEPTIMNLIDDRMNNRPIALRTGDYIALQRAFQNQQKQK
jgi:hypothetical protein